ncbi:hypothetical protein FACS189485_06150 [Spirochaetia bacterium]|nr:hypothetical protein FACS189485_06150 [Spirochaetia bacterium]
MMPLNTGVFATLPENFFSPLAWVNREHYAALLVLFYRLFQENARGLDREQVIRAFTEYLALHRNSLADEAVETGAEAGTDAYFADEPDPIPEIDTGTSELDFGSAVQPAVSDSSQSAPLSFNDRALANRFLRRLINAGWFTEETLSDYTRVINITPWGRPFFEALARVEEGLKTEYESHVVAIYSLLCGDAVMENGHYAVLNAHGSTQALIDSLKVLSQSIKGHYDRFTAEAASQDIGGILHLHYDLYAGEILDGAYKRLKTSDNLSRYRPRITKKVSDLLGDEQWLNDSARKLARNNGLPQSDCRRRLETMLEEIRDTLRAVDPLLDDIDRRNMLYARSSIERVKALLEPDSTLAGKLGALVKEIYNGKTALVSEAAGAADEEQYLYQMLAHRMHRIRTFAPESMYHRYKRDAADFTPEKVAEDREALDKAEEEFRIRMQRQLGLKRISGWLDEQGGGEKLLSSTDLVKDESSFIHFVYSVLYADSRTIFDYAIEDTRAASVTTGGYAVPDVLLRRKG